MKNHKLKFSCAAEVQDDVQVYLHFLDEERKGEKVWNYKKFDKK